MVEKLLDILAIFFEKYFIPSIIAVVLAFITYYKAPADNELLVKFSIKGFCSFVFCLWFLLIVLIIWSIKKFWNSIKNKKYHDALIRENNYKTINSFWIKVDQLSRDDYDLLLEFVNNENKPITITSIPDSYHCLLKSNWIHKTEIESPKKVLISLDHNKNISLNSGYKIIPAKYQYVLVDEIYKLSKYSLDNYGKIGHIKR